MSSSHWTEPFRRDRSSALPVDTNAYNYYGISGSWLFSKHLEYLDWLNIGKVSVNYAFVANDAPWGSVTWIPMQPQTHRPRPVALWFGHTLLIAQFKEQSQPETRRADHQGSRPGTRFPEREGSASIASVYQTNSIEQIIPVTTSTATGYSSKYKNAGELGEQRC